MARRVAACALSVCLAGVPCSAQTPTGADSAAQLVPPPSWAYNDIACAPALRPDKKAGLPVLRVVGVQDPAPRDVMGPGDTLVISGGSNAGLQPGQRFFVRRLVTTATTNETDLPATIHTAGWIQILGVDTAIATATVLHACDGILLDDFLDDFTPPMIAPGPVPGAAGSDMMGRIVTGNDATRMAGIGNVMTIDRGSNMGVVVGQHFLVFRDKRDAVIDTYVRSKALAEMASRTPLVEIAEAVVVSVRPQDATVQILRAKDAVYTGDLVSPIR
jgi:hypothetical protein